MMRPPRWDPSSWHSAARTSFPFSFFLFPSFFFVFLSLLPSSVFSFPFVLLFVLSFSVCLLYRLLRFSFRFPALLGGGFCHFVSVLPPPALRASLQVCVFPLCAAFFLAFLLFIYFIFLLFLPFFRFWTSFVSSFFLVWVLYEYCLLGFGVGCDSLSVWYVSDTYVSWSYLFYFCLRYTICFS